jgi:hypothetical protein
MTIRRLRKSSIGDGMRGTNIFSRQACGRSSIPRRTTRRRLRGMRAGTHFSSRNGKGLRAIRRWEIGISPFASALAVGVVDGWRKKGDRICIEDKLLARYPLRISQKEPMKISLTYPILSIIFFPLSSPSISATPLEFPSLPFSQTHSSTSPQKQPPHPQHQQPPRPEEKQCQRVPHAEHEQRHFKRQFAVQLVDEAVRDAERAG